MANEWTNINSRGPAAVAVDNPLLNEYGNCIKTLGYGVTPGTVTWDANENHIGDLGLVTFAAGGGIVQDLFTNAVLQNGWFTLGAHQSAAYRLDKQGNLVLRISISGGTFTDGTLLFTLPLAFRPTGPRTIVAANGGSLCLLTILSTDGTVKIYNAVGNATLHFNGPVPL